MLDYKTLESLYFINEHNSFARAATDLGITQSAISQRISSLESRLGILLIKRGKKIALTAEGKLLVEHIQKVKLLESNLYNLIEKSKNQLATISVAVNADSLATWWLDCVKGFAVNHQVLFDIKVKDQSEGLNLLADGSVQGCVCNSSQSLSGSRSYPIGRMTYAFYCTTEFYATYFQSGIDVFALQRAPSVIFGSDDTLHSDSLAQYGFSGNFLSHTCPSSEGLLEMISNGMAYGILPVKQVAQLNDIKLVKIFNEDVPDIVIDLYWHYWRGGSKLLENLTNILLSKETQRQIW